MMTEDFCPGICISWIEVTLTSAVQMLEIDGYIVGPGPGVWTSEEKE
jgi:hypothetical protein